MAAVQRARRPSEDPDEESKKFQPTVRVFLKAKQLHHGVLRQLLGLGGGHVGVTGAGEHVAPVMSPGADTSVLHHQQQALLDAHQDAVGVFNLIQNDDNAVRELKTLRTVVTC